MPLPALSRIRQYRTGRTATVLSQSAAQTMSSRLCALKREFRLQPSKTAIGLASKSKARLPLEKPALSCQSSNLCLKMALEFSWCPLLTGITCWSSTVMLWHLSGFCLRRGTLLSEFFAHIDRISAHERLLAVDDEAAFGVERNVGSEGLVCEQSHFGNSASNSTLFSVAHQY